MSNPVRITDLRDRKAGGPKIAMMTAYDATMARLLDRAGIDVILVGDSLGMVVMGHDTTLPVTMDVMVHHSRAVAKGAQRALIVADMPFLSYQASIDEAVRNAGRLLQEGNAAAVKVEGASRCVLDLVERLVEIGIPVMGHVGLTPQAVHQLGGYRRVGKSDMEQQKVTDDAHALAQAGAFAIVVECVPPSLAETITSSIDVPTIGIGAGPHCDGQVLVSYDAFGLYDEFVPPFVKQYADLGSAIVKATREYIEDVREARFPPLTSRS